MNSKRDENRISTLAATLNTDGETFIPVRATEVTHRLNCSDGISGTDLGPSNAIKDENRIPTLLAISSVDFITPVVVYADSSGKLLIDSS